MPLDTTTLQMALLGYEAERQKMQEKIDELQARLNGRASSPMTRTPAKRTKRRMSAAARKRIADAQKKRWAAYRKQKAA